MKKNVLKSSLIALGTLIMAACQQVPPAVNNGGYPEAISEDDGVKFCADGTLDCYIAFPPEVPNIVDLPFNQSYDTCVSSCLVDQGCMTTMPGALDSCPTAYAQCDAQCDLISEDSPLADYPESDGLTLPPNPKVVVVDIEACYSANGNPTEIHFQGPTAHFVTPIEGAKKTVNGVLGNKEVKVGYGIGRNPSCSDSDLKNRIKVTFTPLAENSVSLNGINYATVPFSTTTAISKTYKHTHSVGFGIPVEIRNEVNLSQITWVAKEFHEPTGATTFFGIDVINAFYYYNNDIPYGDSIAIVAPSVQMNQKISMYLFMESN